MPNGWRLAIAGSTGGFGAQDELLAVEQSSRRSDIDILGYVPGERLEELYSRASVFAFPSLDEGFGMPVLDAMAHGIPVVTSSRSALPDVAGHAAALIDPEDIEALGEALRTLARNEDLREDLAQHGRHRALQFPWQKAIERTWSVYVELR